MNYFVVFCQWLWMFLHVSAVLGGLVSLAYAVWLFCTSRGKSVLFQLFQGEEYRCRRCEDFLYCDAALTGVAYPCRHFEEKE